MLLTPLAARVPWKRCNNRGTIGCGAATFSSYGASDTTGTWNQRLAVISRSSSTTKEGEDGAEGVLIDLVGS